MDLEQQAHAYLSTQGLAEEAWARGSSPGRCLPQDRYAHSQYDCEHIYVLCTSHAWSLYRAPLPFWKISSYCTAIVVIAADVICKVNLAWKLLGGRASVWSSSKKWSGRYLPTWLVLVAMALLPILTDLTLISDWLSTPYFRPNFVHQVTR